MLIVEEIEEMIQHRTMGKTLGTRHERGQYDSVATLWGHEC